MDVYEMTLDGFLKVAASRSSTPGGGSISVVQAAISATMISMVANLTLGKKGYEKVQDQVKKF